MVYFIRNKGDGSIKIGSSGNPEQRMRQLQTATAHRLELLAVIPGELKQERAIQATLKPYEIGGEWFRPDPVVLGLMESLVIASGDGSPKEGSRAAGLEIDRVAVWRIDGEVDSGSSGGQEELFVVTGDASRLPNADLAMDIVDPRRSWIRIDNVQLVAELPTDNRHSFHGAVHLIDGASIPDAILNSWVLAADRISRLEQQAREYREHIHNLERKDRSMGEIPEECDIDI